TFVPTWKGIAKRALDDRRTDDRVVERRRPGDHLFAERFGVGVRVGPAPVLGAFHPSPGQLVSQPQLPLPPYGQAQSLVVVVIPPFLGQPIDRGLSKSRG